MKLQRKQPNLIRMTNVIYMRQREKLFQNDNSTKFIDHSPI